MKKIQMFFAAIAFIAVTSAFATKAKTTDIYIRNGSVYELLSDHPGSFCDARPEFICKYEKTGDAGQDPNTNPANFTPIDSDQEWIHE